MRMLIINLSPELSANMYPNEDFALATLSKLFSFDLPAARNRRSFWTSALSWTCQFSIALLSFVYLASVFFEFEFNFSCKVNVDMDILVIFSSLENEANKKIYQTLIIWLRSFFSTNRLRQHIYRNSTTKTTV